MKMFKFNSIEEALQDLHEGKIIIVTDDEDRENEGDFICASEFATTENVNFMATHAKGLICMPMSKEICDKLQLSQMVSNNTDNHSTAFTVSIDHVDTTTGISAVERSLTAIKCVDENSKPEDFRRPGHMFPLLAKENGDFRAYGYINKLNGEHHIALVKGDVGDGKDLLVRVHSECLTGDAFGSQRCDCGEQFSAAMRQIEEEGRGILLYMRQEGRYK